LQKQLLLYILAVYFDKMGSIEQITAIFLQNGGYARTKDILDAGLNHYYLAKLEKEGKIIKVKRGLYRLLSVSVDDELAEVQRLVPDGVICLFSAWAYYGLSDFVPPQYHVAIEKSKKVVLPEYPPIKLYYWSQQYWEAGVEKVAIDGHPVAIYNKEKSVCDAIKFRNKIGKETEKEILENYLKQKERNIDLLLQYAKQLRVDKQIKSYLSILL
jgi:predicted transcriptional regulator of viral defense system